MVIQFPYPTFSIKNVNSDYYHVPSVTPCFFRDEKIDKLPKKNEGL